MYSKLRLPLAGAQVHLSFKNYENESITVCAKYTVTLLHGLMNDRIFTKTANENIKIIF
jgi:hypothetical protein